MNKEATVHQYCYSERWKLGIVRNTKVGMAAQVNELYGSEAVLPSEIQILSLRVTLMTRMTQEERHQ